ncbi:exopolyphosphatase [Crenobacter sp. SG2303]|uniref:Exopolyphosphatase n=1 Tax=Crenobacter oryzisoli TaxID=3056844 RepID=A0ABT7XJ74_9NEIS|nr:MULTISPECIES: exopolyphosphatase [unclassified Crenobacter]MDN0073849.1 exopolyphosphatase [Crenobacter sp. SG2303]MDN0081782.1 exopolyphosphatase [Crenobacter sp. SG2305]
MTNNTPQYDVLATVDLGSNSFRLQVSRVLDDQLYTLDTLKETVRLGAGLTEDKFLDDDTQERALACLARFGERLRGLERGQVRVVGTNTLRVAKNAPAFIAQAEALLGFPIEIIAGREEARLIYLGAAHSLPATREKRLVVDIGGGSTEFIIGTLYKSQVTESLPLGCVTYSLRYFRDGKLTQSAFQDAVLAARSEVQRIAADYRREGWQLAVGTSGTARSLRDVLEINDYSSTDITLAGMERLRDELIKLGSIKKSTSLNGLKSDRAPVLPGGLAVMIALFEELGIERMTVADGALRDGVLYDLMGRQRERDMRDTTVTQFKRRYHVDLEQANRVQTLAERFYLMVAGEDVDQNHLKRVLWAARLHEIGLTIAHTAYHKHSAYILQNADMPGFSKHEQTVLSTIVVGHRGDMGKMLDLVTDPALWQAVVSLRLAALFYRRRQDIELPGSLGLKANSHGFTLCLDTDWLSTNPLTASAFKLEVSQWRKIGFALEIEEAA